MKSKGSLAVAIFQLVIGLLAIGAFIVLGLGGENMTKWIITFMLAVSHVVLGIIKFRKTYLARKTDSDIN